MASVPKMGINSLSNLKRMAYANDFYKKTCISYAISSGWQGGRETDKRAELSWLDAWQFIDDLAKNRANYYVHEINEFILKDEPEWVDLSEWKPVEYVMSARPSFLVVAENEGDENFEWTRGMTIGPFASGVQAAEFEHALMASGAVKVKLEIKELDFSPQGFADYVERHHPSNPDIKPLLFRRGKSRDTQG
jgi:hypothetical protein